MENQEQHNLAELIERCRKGDRKAQMEIYELYYKSMYNTSLRILNHREEAEDVMHDAFLTAFERIGQFRGEGAFGGWLRRIVVNHSLDALKKRMDFLTFDSQDIEIPDQQPDNYVEQAEYSPEEIVQGMNRLRQDYRIVLSLHLLEGYDHEEISKILGISYDNARTKYSRARKKLISSLSEQRVVRMFQPN
ncbi:MAG: RNA polymerase sigma factor [Bacteroidales bacterium]|nr:RNA polymerase sigma factor [Bacteroidales bacterium]